MPYEHSHSIDESQAIQDLKDKLSRFETEHGRRKGLSYQPRPNDVVITTTPKAGTTWMQQICHQLRTGGDTSFDEISRVVPWLELAHDQGQDLEAPQCPPDPRLFKTHAWEPHCPKFPRTIVVFRHPYDVLLSFFHFFEGWFFAPGTVSLESFAEEFWLARGVPTSLMENASYFVHLVSWFPRVMNDPTVLGVCYEDLRDDLRGEVERVARFLSTPTSGCVANVDVATAMSTFTYMDAHRDQFDEKLSKQSRNEACGLPVDAGAGVSKIRRGDSSICTDGCVGVSALPDVLRARIDDQWKQVVYPVTQCVDYASFRALLRQQRTS